MILTDHHIKMGYDLQEDDHCLVLTHRRIPIARWSTTGILSANEIYAEIDRHAEERMNLGNRILPDMLRGINV